MEKEFNKEDWSVRTIDYEDCKEWFMFKHYAHRMPSISYAYGLYKGNIMEGVCSFGIPATPNIQKGAFREYEPHLFIELNRLCVNEGLPKNTLSWFVARCLEHLPHPCCVVSYADSGHNHHGYIYQATNWLYTGHSESRTMPKIVGEEDAHFRSNFEKYKGNGESRGDVYERMKKDGKITMEEWSFKYRYFMFLGNKREKQELKKHLRYKEQPYPKGDNVRYDASYQCSSQILLF